MEPYADAVTETGSGVTILLDVTAGAKDLVSGRLQRVAEEYPLPGSGPGYRRKANRAVIDLIADIGVSRADVSIISGHTSTKDRITSGLSKSEILTFLSASGA